MIERGLRFATGAGALIGMLGMAAMLLHITADVIGRWVFAMPLPVTIEMTAHYYMVAIVFFPLAAVEFKNGHIAVEIVSQYLKPPSRRFVVGLGCLLGAAYFAILTARTWHDAVGKYAIGEYLYGTIQLEIWQSRLFVPLGTGLLTLILVWKAVMLFRGEQRLLDEGATTMSMD